jgi:Type I restriction enzyme R protein N terminus (HSDR_N)
VSSGIMNEPAVIIAPILRALGYRFRGEHGLQYEVTLRDTHDFLGRKKPATDPLLRGRADYVCTAGDKVAWVIEAKPSKPISNDDIAQAYTYAKHVAIRAKYFCLCNGLEFRVYATDGVAGSQPLRTVDPSEPVRAAAELASLLGPERLLADFAVLVADSRPAIGLGLRSFVEIVGGRIVYDSFVPDLPHMRGFTISITGGSIQRIEDGRLLAYYKSQGPYESIQQLLWRLGLSRVDAVSSSGSLSIDTREPTVFVTESTAVFPQGERVLDLSNHEEKVFLRDVRVRLTARASGALSGDRFSGEFELNALYEIDTDNGSSQVAQVRGLGRFELFLR